MEKKLENPMETRVCLKGRVPMVLRKKLGRMCRVEDFGVLSQNRGCTHQVSWKIMWVLM